MFNYFILIDGLQGSLSGVINDWRRSCLQRNWLWFDSAN